MIRAEWTNKDALDLQPTALDLQPTCDQLTTDCISRQAAIEVITQLLNEFEEMCAKIREENGDESVCGLCEYDGAYVGESGDWCNECPGFNREDCFEMREDYRQGWINQIIARAKTNEAERGSK